MYWTKLVFVLLPVVNVKAADDYIGTNRKLDNDQNTVHRVPRPLPKPIEIGPVEIAADTESPTYTTAPRARLASSSRPDTTSPQTNSTSESPQIILFKKSEPKEKPTITEPAAKSPSPVSSDSNVVKPEEVKVVNNSQDPSSSVGDPSTSTTTASPASTVYVVLLNGDSKKPEPSTRPIEISPSYVEVPSYQEPTPVQKDVSPAPSEPVILITPRPLPSKKPTTKPQPVQTVPPSPPAKMEPAIILEIEPEKESRPLPAPVETSTPRVIKIVLPREEAATSKPLVNEPVIVPTNQSPILISKTKPEEPKIKLTPAPVEPIVVYQPTTESNPAPPASNVIVYRPSQSWEAKKKPPSVQTASPPPTPKTQPALILEIEPEVESHPSPAPDETSSPKVVKIVLPSKEPAKPKPEVNEPVIVPAKRDPISLPESRPKPEEPKIEPKITVIQKPTPAPVKPIVVYQSTPAPAPAPPASNVFVFRPTQSWESTKKPISLQTAPPQPTPTTHPALIWEIEPEVESRPSPTHVETPSPPVIKIVLPSREPAIPKSEVNEPVIVPVNRRPMSLLNSRNELEEPIIIVSPKPETIEPKPAPVKPVVVYQPTPAPASEPPPTIFIEYIPQPTAASSNPEPMYIEPKSKPTPAPVALTIPSKISRPQNPITLSPSQLFDYNCRRTNGFYEIANDCDSYVECKNHVASLFTCPEGLHFNPKATWPEYPCGYPWEVQCESNARKQQPRPTSECPHQYGYFALADDCDKYAMCQEGRAIVMNCPPGLAFSIATNSCDWPENVPSCNPDAFGGFTCPAPPLDALGAPLDFISKYRYGQSCREYVACQHGRPRLLSCDSGLSFDEVSQVCIDSDYVQNCLP